MENATKALLIAASVLIAIILIAVGIKILGATKPTIEQVGKVSTALEVSVYNSQFVNYEGYQRGNAVKALLRLIKQNNTTDSNNISIKEQKNGSETNISSDGEYNAFIERIDVTHTYNVKFSTDSQTGYINNATIIF